MSLKERIQGITRNLMICVLAVCFGTQFQFYNNVVGSNLATVFQKWFNKTYILHYGQPLTDEQYSWAYALVTSCQQIGALITALCMKMVAERLGRRKTLIITGLIEALGAVIAGLSKLALSFEMMGVGRFIIGLGFGMGSGVASMMISELAPSNKVRGAIGTTQQIFIGLGLAGGFIFTLPQLFGTDYLWPIALALPAIPALLQTMIMIWAHDTPKFLLLTKGNRKASSMSLIFYRGDKAAQQTLADLEREADQAKNNIQYSFIQMAKKRIYRKPLFISFMVMFAVQFTGCSPVVSYSKTIFTSAGLSEEDSELCSVGLGLMNLIIPFIVLVLIEKLGRRILMLTGLTISFVTLLVTTLLIHFNQPMAAIPFVYIFQIGYAVGSSVAWVMPAELFPQNVRAYGVSISVCSYWLCQLITLLCYLPFKDAVGIVCSFIPFLCITVATFTYFYFFMPETKGKSPEQLIFDEALSTGSRRGSKRTATVAPAPIIRTLSVPSFHVDDGESDKQSVNF